MTPSSQIEWVTPEEIRNIFNEEKFYDKTLTGELIAVTMKDRQLQRRLPGMPVGTKSQILYYYTKKRQLVAIVHQYLLPNGSIGGSGLPDPKKLILGPRIICTR